MKFFFAANAFTGIKVQALNYALNRNDITNTSLSGLATSAPEEQEAFEKCTKFFEQNNFRKHYEKIIDKNPKIPDNLDKDAQKSYEKGYSRIYDTVYNGVLKVLGTNEFPTFFNNGFDIAKIDGNGDYQGFKQSFNSTHDFGRIKDILNSYAGISAKLNDSSHSDKAKKVNNSLQQFQRGDKTIDDLYDAVNEVVNSLEGTTSQINEKREEDAWRSIGNPIITKGAYGAYEVRKWEDMNAVAGFTKWCVAQDGNSGRNYFDGDGGYIYPNYDEEGKPTSHIHDRKNAYYLIAKGRTPVALFNISTTGSDLQFKDVDDYSIIFYRKTSFDIIGLGYELRKMLGNDSYDNDFVIFKEYEKRLRNKDYEVDLDIDYFKEVEKNPSLMQHEEIRKEFVKSMYKNDTSGIIAKNLALLDYPDVYSVFSDRLKYGYGYRALISNPKLLENPEIRSIFADSLKDRYGLNVIEANIKLLENSEIRSIFIKSAKVDVFIDILEKNPILFKYSDIKSSYCEYLKNGKGYLILIQNDKLLDDLNIRSAFVEAFKKGYGYRILEKDSTLLDGLFDDEDVVHSFAESLKMGIGFNILNRNPSLLENSEIINACSERIKDKYFYYSTDFPGKLFEYSDFRLAFAESLKKCDLARLEFIEKNPSLLEYPEIKSTLVECLANGKGSMAVRKNPGLLEDQEIKSAFVGCLKNGDNFYLLSKNPNLLNEYLSNEDIRKNFIRLMKEQNQNAEIIENNDGLLEDPEIKSAFVECLKKGEGNRVLINNPSLLEDLEIRSAFVEELKKGEGSYVLYGNLNLLEDQKIKSAFMSTLGYYGKGFGIIENNLNLLKDVSIRGCLARRLYLGQELSIIEKNPRLFDYPDIRDAIVMSVKAGNGEPVLGKFPNLLDYQDVRQAFIETIGNPEGNCVLEKNPSLLDHQDIRQTFAKELKNTKESERHNNFNVLKSNPSLLEDPEIKSGLAECLRKNKGFGFLADNPSLINYPDIKSVFVEYLKKGEKVFLLDSHFEMFNDSDIKSAFIESFNIEKNRNNESNWSIVNKHPELLNNAEIMKACLEAIKHFHAEETVKYISDIKILKKIVNDDDSSSHRVLMNVISNEKSDKMELYNLCKTFANTEPNLMDLFFQCFCNLSDSEAFQNDLWDYVEKSKYFFEIIKNNYSTIPRERMKKYLNSNDEDIKWIAEKTIFFSKETDSFEKKASCIANRIAKENIVIEMLMRKS